MSDSKVEIASSAGCGFEGSGAAGGGGGVACARKVRAAHGSVAVVTAVTLRANKAERDRVSSADMVMRCDEEETNGK